MPNSCTLDSSGIILNFFDGDQTYETVTENARQLDAITKDLRKQNKKVLVLLDLSGMGKQESQSRKAVIEALGYLDFDKYAVTGANHFIKQVANLVIFASGRGEKLKYFDTKDEAIKWLESNG